MKNYFRTNSKNIEKVLFCFVIIVNVFAMGFLVGLDKSDKFSAKETEKSASSATVKFEKNKEKLKTTKEYQNLCKKLAEFANVDQVEISACEAYKVSQNLLGDWVITDVRTNSFWIWAEKHKSDSDSSSSLEDLVEFFSEYNCSSAGAKPGEIVPEKFVTKKCKLSKEIEKEIGYTSEEIVDIYVHRYDYDYELESVFSIVYEEDQ